MKIKKGNRANNREKAETPSEDKFYEEVTVINKATY